MLVKDDIIKLRSGTNDDSVFNYAYKQDASFKSAVDRIKTANPDMSDLEKAKFSTAILNRHYLGSWNPDKTPQQPLTTQAAQSAIESSQETAPAKPQGILDPYTVESQMGGGLSAVAAGGANILKSAGRFGKGLGEAALNVFNPDPNQNTIVNTGKLALGAGANAIETAAGAVTGKNQENLLNVPGEDIATKVGGFYKQRYGSSDALLKTLYEDPVGFLADLSAAVSAAGGVAKLAGKAGQLGTSLATAGAESVPLDSAAAKAGQMSSGIVSGGQALVNAGVGIDPAVMAGKGVLKVAKSIAGAPERAAEKMVASSLKLNPSDVKKIVKGNVAGVKPEQWLLDKGLIGAAGDTADSLAKKLDDFASESATARDQGLAGIPTKYAITDKVNIGDLAAKYGGEDNIPLSEINKAEANRVAQIATQPRIGEALDVLQKNFEGTVGNEKVLETIKSLRDKGTLNLSEINSIKQLIDRHIKLYGASGDVKSGAMAEGLKNVRSDLQKFIETEAAKNGFTEVKDLNKNVQVANKISEAIANSAARRGSNRVLSLTDFIVGSAGSLTGGPVGGAATVVAKKLLENPRLKTGVANVLNKLSPESFAKLEKALIGSNPSAKAASMIQNILQQAQQSVGAVGTEAPLLPTRANN